MRKRAVQMDAHRHQLDKTKTEEWCENRWKAVATLARQRCLRNARSSTHSPLLPLLLRCGIGPSRGLHRGLGALALGCSGTRGGHLLQTGGKAWLGEQQGHTGVMVEGVRGGVLLLLLLLFGLPAKSVRICAHAGVRVFVLGREGGVSIGGTNTSG